MSTVLNHSQLLKKNEEDTSFFFAVIEEMESENSKDTLIFRKEIDTYLTYKKLNSLHMHYFFCFLGAFFTSMSFYTVSSHPGIIAYNEAIVGIGGLLLLWFGLKMAFPHLYHESQIVDYLNNRSRKTKKVA